jgi:hypothetical protein
MKPYASAEGLRRSHNVARGAGKPHPPLLIPRRQLAPERWSVIGAWGPTAATATPARRFAASY